MTVESPLLGSAPGCQADSRLGVECTNGLLASSHTRAAAAPATRARARASWPTRPPDPSRTMRDDEPVSTGSAALLEPRLVGDVEGKFFVRDYQRGYRWGPDEVRRLLDDIKDAGGRDYYLQPVVVKRLEDGQWELVDGQQRLTTLYLVLHYIKRHMPTAELRYTLTYETRPGSASYLDSPTEAASFGNIDYFHIYQALKSIETWFGEQRNETLAAIELFTALSKTVYLIWYEAPQTARVRLPHPLHPSQRRANPADRCRAGQGAAAVAGRA